MSLANKIAPRLLGLLSDRHYSTIQFLYKQRRIPNLAEPKTFNEKIQWLKLNYRDPLLVQCADKLRVRDYVRSAIPGDILIPLLGVYDSPADIPFEELPERFVIKATHGSGWNILCRAKVTFDAADATRRMDDWMKANFYDVGREWAYKDVPPRIICEAFISLPGGEPPPDYKIFCFHGEPAYIQVDYGRFTNHTRNIYDLNWNQLPFQLEYPNEPNPTPAPQILDELITTAKALALPFPFVRVDMYALEGKLYFGELTFYPEKGVGRFSPRKYDLAFGQHFEIDRI
jgi:hypothetical protein